MDHHERSMARARAEWRAKRAGKTSSSLWGFENWSKEGTEAKKPPMNTDNSVTSIGRTLATFNSCRRSR